MGAYLQCKLSLVSTFGLQQPDHGTAQPDTSRAARGHGPHHRNIHTGLLGEVRGVPEGPRGGLHPEEGRPRLHPSDDHLRGGWQLDHGHQDHGQEHRAEIQLGEEFEEDTTDGRHCKTVVTLEGNTMTTTQNATKAGEKNVVVVREFNDEGLTYKATCDGVTSTQKFKRD